MYQSKLEVLFALFVFTTTGYAGYTAGHTVTESLMAPTAQVTPLSEEMEVEWHSEEPDVMHCTSDRGVSYCKFW